MKKILFCWAIGSISAVFGASAVLGAPKVLTEPAGSGEPASLAVPGAAEKMGTAGAGGERLVILHTNDTHSNIEPGADGSGGILQRKAIFDSVRRAEKNVITVDAGDAVQGSLYFKFFRGDVEYPLMNMMDYDIRILGNHEFDNGLEDLARQWKKVEGARLSANYDFTGTVAEGIFDPWTIKKIGGKKIGFLGINVDPESLIVASNYAGMKFKDIVTTANETAEFLKHKKGCDLVVAVTHIGYRESSPGKSFDIELAEKSRDIDIIIGAHSHTLVNPCTPDKTPHIFRNVNGRPVLVAQTGKYGKKIGRIEIDLDELKSSTPADYSYTLIPVTDRFSDEQLDKRMMAFLKPYKHVVDSVNSHVIGYSATSLANDDRNGGYANWTADFAMWYGRLKADSLTLAGHPTGRPELSLMNVGGIRQNMPAGEITEGQLLSTFPFSNSMIMISIKGADIMEALRVAAGKGGEAISGNVRVVTDDEGNLIRVVIDGEEMDPDKTYRLMTIDYVAEGNDDMRSMANHEVIWRDDVEMCAPLLRYVRHTTELGLPVAPDPTGRFIKQIRN